MLISLYRRCLIPVYFGSLRVSISSLRLGKHLSPSCFPPIKETSGEQVPPSPNVFVHSDAMRLLTYDTAITQRFHVFHLSLRSLA